MSFEQLGLAEPIVRAVTAQGYVTPTPIQQAAIPPLLTGRDLLGCAQTGTGKTAAFALPILHRLAGSPRAAAKRPLVLVVTPTRELAIQIGDNLRDYGAFLPLTSTVIYGGVGQRPQVEALQRGVHLLVATPGRLLDLAGQGYVDLSGLTTFVLDEADRMLDMGFLPDVRKVIALIPPRRQTLLFSATMPPEIVQIANDLLHDPVRVEVSRESTTAEGVTQRAMFVDKEGKKQVITELVRDPRVRRALVFTRTKHGANRLAQRLEKAGIRSAAIHGNKSQGARQAALEGFRDGSVPVLVATDLAARGIDVEGITHVINYEVPNEPESYVHRIGRTARAGATGLAISLVDTDEIPYLRDIERLTGARIPVVADRIGLPPDVVNPGPLGAEPRRQAAPAKGGGARRSGGSRGRRR